MRVVSAIVAVLMVVSGCAHVPPERVQPGPWSQPPIATKYPPAGAKLCVKGFPEQFIESLQGFPLAKNEGANLDAFDESSQTGLLARVGVVNGRMVGTYTMMLWRPNGEETLLWSGDSQMWPSNVAFDGRRIVYTVTRDRGWEMYAVDLENDHTPRMVDSRVQPLNDETVTPPALPVLLGTAAYYAKQYPEEAPNGSSLIKYDFETQQLSRGVRIDGFSPVVWNGLLVYMKPDSASATRGESDELGVIDPKTDHIVTTPPELAGIRRVARLASDGRRLTWFSWSGSTIWTVEAGGQPAAHDFPVKDRVESATIWGRFIAFKDVFQWWLGDTASGVVTPLTAHTAGKGVIMGGRLYIGDVDGTWIGDLAAYPSRGHC